ncbi:LacI family DNA-binding transcriptional regulator [Xylophilus sp. GOD-11R]|uniref:LacI family DNA-binding transcriptional regulator n=1 Tax=Xylophilus sp. GOD-11R TaxID=3089814 RepID=UPI00298C868F|nr:LacI family DNA-binding transcriptional regulator [Xylophilus sp. GOD-11R]WPB58457.1 LacI family DNA-binding transcriptional regulator [Xylophilus sp. GOD-11R]
MNTSSLLDAEDLPRRRPRRGSGRVTLMDVAQLAGVSAQTVSRSLNSPESVPPATLAKVREAIATAGYVPDRLAGALASGRSRLVAALIPTIGSPVFQDTLQALSQTLAQRGYQLMLGECGYDDADEAQLIENLLGRRPDGIVLTRLVQGQAVRDRLLATRIPVVETWDLTAEPVDMLIGFCHGDVGRAVADFLAGQGRRHPALVTGDDPRAGLRGHSFANQLAALGVLAKAADLPVARAPSPFTVGMARTATRELLDQHPQIDAIFCSTDLIAWGAITEIQASGRRVPEDVAVVGFGDLNFSQDTIPSITSVRTHGAVIGEQAAQWVMDRAEGRSAEAHRMDVGFALIRRGST